MLLRDRAGSTDVLRGAFHAHLLLHRLDTANSTSPAAHDEPPPDDTARPGNPPGKADAEQSAWREAPAVYSAVSDIANDAADGTSSQGQSDADGGHSGGTIGGSLSRQRTHRLGPDGGIGPEMLRSIRTQADSACAEYLAACAGLGWDLGQTMLNPHEPRLVDYVL